MAPLAYYLFILPLSWLPMRMLHGISDFLYWVIYRGLGYRRAVVAENLRRSFPDLSESERKEIESRFYRHLCDLVVESVKLFSISEREIRQHYHFVNPELINDYAARGRSVILVGGHYGNWELLATASGLDFDPVPAGIYRPLRNAFFEKKMRKSRTRFGMELWPNQEAKMRFENLSPQAPRAIIFGSDQAPTSAAKAYWMEFLNQDTPVFFGAERYAVRHNLPVLYLNITKDRRGFYTTRFDLITEDPASHPYGWITETHVGRLEETIRRQPEFWLWSHKRWKLKRKEPMNKTLPEVEAET